MLGKVYSFIYWMRIHPERFFKCMMINLSDNLMYLKSLSSESISFLEEREKIED